MKQLIIIAMCLLSVSIMWARTPQESATLVVDSIEEVNRDTSSTANIVRSQIQELLPYWDDLYISKKQIDNEIMKTKIILGITLKALCVILGVLVITLCLIVGGLYCLYSRLSKRLERNEKEVHKIKSCVSQVERSTQKCSSKVDDIYKKVREDINAEFIQIKSDIKDKNEAENITLEVAQNTSVEANISDILGYAEYLGSKKMRLFNSPTAETIYIIKRGKNQDEICFIVDSTKVQKAIKNKTVCLDPLCNVIKGSQQSAVDIKTINPGIVQLEQGNIYKVIENAEIELLS